jgi:hypothetical protein
MKRKLQVIGGIIFFIIILFIEFFYDEKIFISNKRNITHSFQNCFIYHDKNELKEISYEVIKNKFSKDIYDRQRWLNIKEDTSKIIVYGQTLGLFRQIFAFGGGGVVLIYNKKDNCIQLTEYLAEK